MVSTFKRAVVVGTLVAGVGGAAAVVFTRGTPVTTAVARRSDLDHRVVASGRVLAPSRASVAATVPGLVVAVGAVLGQHVAAGDLLVQIDDREARAALAQSEASVAQARARVDQLRNIGAIVATQALAQAHANLEKARADAERAQRLAASGAMTEADLEAARRALEVARAQKSAAEAQQLGASAAGADSRVALATLLQAEAQRAAAELRLAQTRVVATAAGTVLARSVEIGDVVQPGKVLFDLAYDGDVQIVFHADERNLATLALGQPALVSADAFPSDRFDAETVTIAPAVDPQRGTVEVRLRVPRAPAYLKPDMTVSVDLLVASKRGVLAAPTEAVRDAATASPWVLVVDGGHARKRPVRLGITGQGTTEIVEGIHEGDELVVSDGRPIADGRRVRATRKAP